MTMMPIVKLKFSLILQSTNCYNSQEIPDVDEEYGPVEHAHSEEPQPDRDLKHRHQDRNTDWNYIFP
jgi:hypothetical protein